MKWKDCKCGSPDLALLVMRLVLAFVFIERGWGKFQNMDGTIAFFGSVGLPMFLAYIVAAVELVGGLAMLTGISTHWAGKLLAIDMIGAIAFVQFPKGGFFGSEFELALFALAIGVSMIGPGKYMLKQKGR